MSKITVQLNKVEVTDGQGIVEGDLELRIQVTEGSNTVVWPSANGSQKVDNGGAQSLITLPVASYNVTSGTLTKSFDISVTEVDGGVYGKDDLGTGKVTIAMTPSMGDTYKSAFISLKRPTMNFNGKVKVTLKAYS